MIWLGIFIGLTLGVGSTCLYFLLNSKDKKVKFLRRGIWLELAPMCFEYLVSKGFTAERF